jgi:DNA-binding CsgD family transcriptional regulator
VLQITPAERVALQLLAEGRSISQVAALLELVECDLEKLLTALFARMRVRTHLEAVAAAVKRGLVEAKPGPNPLTC